MQRLLSTYLFVNRKLTAALVGEAARAGVSAIELFCSRGHFDYRSAEEAHELAGWLAGNNLTLHSIHSPTTRDFHLTRESGAPLSICDPERLRRQEAVDEIKRALDLVEHIPFRYCVQHVARLRDVPDERRWDAAFSSLEHLSLSQRQRGVTIAIENTLGEIWRLPRTSAFSGTDSPYEREDLLRHRTRPPRGRRLKAPEIVRDFVATTHLHDNRGERDDHLLPYEGTIDWSATLAALPPEAPIVLELKEPAVAAGSVEVQAFAETLRGVRTVFEKFEQERG